MIKIPLEISVSNSLHFHLHANVHPWETAGDGSDTWVLATNVRDMNGVLSSWVWLDPTLAVSFVNEPVVGKSLFVSKF